MIRLFALLSSIAFAGEENVDLSSLGLSDFTPYTYERNKLWMALPLISLAILFLHLKKVKLGHKVSENEGDKTP